MNIPYIPIDSATPLKTEYLDDGTAVFLTSDEYKYLSAFETDNGYILKCSKDLKEWETCLAAFINGNLVDPRKAIETIIQAKEGNDDTDDRRNDEKHRGRGKRHIRKGLWNGLQGWIQGRAAGRSRKEDVRR